MKGTMLDEQKRLKELIGVTFRSTKTMTIYRVVEVYHNIYKDVCLKLSDSKGNTRELIEGSEEYYREFTRVDL